MASSSSSDENDENCRAPENFRLSAASNEDEIEEFETANTKEHSNFRRCVGTAESDATACEFKCPLCCVPRRRFHCRNCVKNGNIIHSSLLQRSESLLEKQQKYINIQAGLKAFSNRYERLIKERKLSENINFQIKQKKEKLALLNKMIASKKTEVGLLNKHYTKLHVRNVDKWKHLPNYPSKVQFLGDFVLDRIEKINKLREDRDKLLERLQDRTSRYIQQLVDYIFPITEVMLKDEMRQRAEKTNKNIPTDESETIAALADAKNTSYIRGKWVFHGSGISEVQYRIIAPSLPANGDYSAYLEWLSDNKDDVPKTAGNDVLPSHISAFRIMGALTYTAQLTQLMSFYLNVRLPHKLAYGDFCKKLNEGQFQRRVSRLNSNIMYLAYTQQVKLQDLNEKYTLENILAILDLEKSALGRHGFQEVTNAPLIKSVDSLLIGIETATESESEDENSLRLDWEAVTSLPTQQEISNSDLDAPAAPPSTLAEGLMTSAANHITSIWRWMK